MKSIGGGQLCKLLLTVEPTNTFRQLLLPNRVKELAEELGVEFDLLALINEVAT